MVTGSREGGSCLQAKLGAMSSPLAVGEAEQAAMCLLTASRASAKEEAEMTPPFSSFLASIAPPSDVSTSVLRN